MFTNEPDHKLRAPRLSGLEAWLIPSMWCRRYQLADEVPSSPYPQSDDPWDIPDFLLRTPREERPRHTANDNNTPSAAEAATRRGGLAVCG